MKRELTCIICPRGCTLNVELGDGGEVLKVSGNSCPRGEKYALSECTHPMRTVTSTIRAKDGGIYPVKTDTTVPKELIFEVMKEINKTSPDGTLAIGDIVIKNILDTGANVVVTGKRS